MTFDSDSAHRTDKLCILYLLALFKEANTSSSKLHYTRFSYTLLYIETEHFWKKRSALTSFIWYWNDERSSSGIGARCSPLREALKEHAGIYYKLHEWNNQLSIEVLQPFIPRQEEPSHLMIINAEAIFREAIEWQARIDKTYNMHKDLKINKEHGQRCFPIRRTPWER